jgi:thiamine pyrophosphokinase
MHAVIVSNGFPPSKALLEAELRSADLIIGADAGGNTLLRYGITPTAVVGDMDSFEKPESVNFDIVHDPGQETNDLEKALSFALSQDAETCAVLGGFGRRMDHSLKNLSVLQRFNAAFKELVFKDESLNTVLVQTHFEAELPVGSIVSLFPLSGKVTGITTQGLKYALHGETLENGKRDGSSNENTQPKFSIDLEHGDLVVFTERVKD